MENDCNVDTKKVYSKVEDFLKDDDFIKYVLDDAPESAFHWDKLLKEHAELLKVFEEAKNILLYLSHIQYYWIKIAIFGAVYIKPTANMENIYRFSKKKSVYIHINNNY